MRKKKNKKKKTKKKKEYYAVAVVITKDGKSKTLGRYGKTVQEAIGKVTWDAGKYGEIASIGVYKGDKEIMYKEYPAVEKLRVNAKTKTKKKSTKKKTAKKAKKKETKKANKKKKVVSGIRGVLTRSAQLLEKMEGW